MGTRHKPAYELQSLSICISEGEVYPSKRVISYLANHGYDAGRLSVEVLAIVANGGGRFHKSDELENVPGVWGDIYYVTYCEEEWCLKFYIEDGAVVLSCKPDGMNW
jgi:hypothetical protein